MKTVLERAREEAFVSREQAAAYLAQVKACFAEGYRDEEDITFARQVLEEAQATLDAIDAAIAAQAPATTEVSINLGDGRSVTLNASATDLGKLTEVSSKKRRLRIPFVADIGGIDAAIAAEAPAKKTEPLRIPIEFDTSALVEELEGAIAYLKSEKPGFATGGVATGKAPFGVVGEPAGETVAAVDRPIQIGDAVEIRTPIRVIGMSERSTDGHNLGVPKKDGPFCQVEVQGILTNHVIEVLASDLRRL